MMLVEQGELPVSEGFVDHIDKCLDCRSCETACPSAVNYGKLVEHARARIERDFKRPLFSCMARNLVYRRLLPYPERIAVAARLLRVYQRSGLQAAARATGILKLLRLAERDLFLPPGDRPFLFDQLGQALPARGTP